RRRQSAARLPARRQDCSLWRADELDERAAGRGLSPRGAGRARSRQDVIMVGSQKTSALSRWPEAARWGACFALAIAFHAAGAAALFARWSEDSNLVAGTAIIMVDLAPAAVSQNITTDVIPGPLQQEAQPEPEPEKPIEKVELPPDPQAEPIVAMRSGEPRVG